jgi:hypothetical protein
MHALQVYNSGRPPTGSLPSDVAFAVVFATYAGDSSSDLVLKLFRKQSSSPHSLFLTNRHALVQWCGKKTKSVLLADRQTATPNPSVDPSLRQDVQLSAQLSI